MRQPSKDERNHIFSEHNQAVRDTVSTLFDDRINQLTEITETDTDDVSINLENQRAYVLGKNRRLKPIVRTVYRVRFIENELVGHIMRMSDRDKFPLYRFNRKNKGWYPVENTQ